jgi:predicted DNA-binding transcriptional regulator AlpA
MALEKKPLFTLTTEELEALFVNCVNSCLQNNSTLTNSPEPDRWLNLPALCEYLPGRPVKATIYGKVSKRIIPFHKKGRELFFLKSEIDAWLKEGRRKTNREIEAEASEYLQKKGRD